MDNALKVANNFQKTKNKLENEIKTLKKQVNEKVRLFTYCRMTKPSKKTSKDSNSMKVHSG